MTRFFQSMKKGVAKLVRAPKKVKVTAPAVVRKKAARKPRAINCKGWKDKHRANRTELDGIKLANRYIRESKSLPAARKEINRALSVKVKGRLAQWRRDKCNGRKKRT